MANKTTWKSGQSGNPSGRPPKSRALTEMLLAAANEKCSDGDGGQISRKKLLAKMVWQLLIAGEVTFFASNRDWGSNQTFSLKAADWFEVVKWVFAQVDGDLSIQIRDEENEESGPTGDGLNPPILYLPDNGRETKDKEAPKSE